MYTYKASLTEYWQKQVEEVAGETLSKEFTVILDTTQARKVHWGELRQITDLGPMDEMVKANFGSEQEPNEWMVPLAGIRPSTLKFAD